VDNESWWRPLKTSPDYLEYFHHNYGERRMPAAGR
jgi:hypothetical protein